MKKQADDRGSLKCIPKGAMQEWSGSHIQIFALDQHEWGYHLL